MRDLLLASASPRRAELLSRIVPTFDVVAADIDEGRPTTAPDPSAVVVELATAKARRGSELFPAKRVIAADTLVVMEGRAMGKPATAKEARVTLEAVSGQRLEVITGTAVLSGSDLDLDATTSTVWMAELDHEQIAGYVSSGAWVDKAGGLEVQGRARVFVDRVAGCWTNIVGLPLCSAARLLGVRYPPGSCDVPAPSAP